MLVTIKYWIWGRKGIRKDTGKALRIALKRAGHKCELTGKKGTLEGHHLWDVSTYPFFAACAWNYIILKKKLHTKFHAWMGGTQKSCTIFHFWLWRYFYQEWWKGYGCIIAIAVIAFLILKDKYQL